MYFETVNSLFEEKKVVTIEPVFGELLQGVGNQSKRNILMEFWKYLPKVDGGNLLIQAVLKNSEIYQS